MSKSLFPKTLLLLLLVSSFVSCETEDILPTLELSADATNLSEANSTTNVTATLNAPATSQLNIPLSFSGTAMLNSDYALSAMDILINEGQTTGSITITGAQDDLVEGQETIVISLGNASGVLVFENSDLTINLQDDDSDTDGDGVLDANDDCPDLAGDVLNNGCPFLGFLINEVLYDPPSDLAGDANNDGTRDPNDDEFIEFFNSGPELDMSGYTISDADQLRHTFPPGTIVPANGVIVIFGGGTPTGSFGGAIVQTASEGALNMSNSGDFVTVADQNGTTIVTFDVEPLSNNPDESYTRNPDLTGDFVQHSSVEAGNGALYSPGTRVDGSSF